MTKSTWAKPKANCAILFVGLIAAGAVAQLYLATTSLWGNEPFMSRMPTLGRLLNLPGEKVFVQSKGIVLALQTTCHFCNESAPFYKRLIDYARDKNIKIVAVFPEAVEESKAHLAELGLFGLDVRQAPISAFELTGTPTLILTNEKGEIISYWIGKLAPKEEEQVLAHVNAL